MKPLWNITAAHTSVVQRSSAPRGPACTRNTNAVDWPVHKPASPLTAAPCEDNWRMMSPIVHQIGNRAGENIEAVAWISTHWSSTVWRQKRRLSTECPSPWRHMGTPVRSRWKSIRLYNRTWNVRVFNNNREDAWPGGIMYQWVSTVHDVVGTTPSYVVATVKSGQTHHMVPRCDDPSLKGD